MDFNYTEEQFMLIDTLRKMGERENFRQLAKDIDARASSHITCWINTRKWDFWAWCCLRNTAAAGRILLRQFWPLKNWPSSGPMIAAPVFESNVGPVRAIDMFGTEEQKKAIIPGVCRGENSVSVCMTEPEAGSDLTSLSTKIEDKGDHYLLNGRKIFITGGGHASHYLVYSRFNDMKGYKGIGAVLVEKGTPGFTFGKQEEFMGLRGMPSCDLIFEDVKVPKENLVVKQGEFKNLMTTFDIERCGNAAMCLGVAGGALKRPRNTPWNGRHSAGLFASSRPFSS
jgi:alkylation response protein AidB-like acyl-CoA dehydrogenase